MLNAVTDSIIIIYYIYARSASTQFTTRHVKQQSNESST